MKFKQTLFLLLALFLFQGVAQAQNYKGFIYDDVPAMLNVSPSSNAGEFILTIRVAGAEENAWVFTAEFDYNYDRSRERFYGSDNAGAGMFLYDVSSDAGQEPRIILSGYTYSPEDNFEIRKMVFFLDN